MQSLRLVPALLLALAPWAAAQQSDFAAREAAEQARVHAIVGDLGLPELPPASSGPRSQMMFADRLFDPPPANDSAPATLQTFTVPASVTGTGKPEVIWYQIPDGYVAGGPKHPMLIAWHGYGSSAQSVSTLTTLDEECNARGWIYLAVTGIDDKLFGSTPCETNAQAGIQWMIDNFDVDVDRLYMVGWSMGGGIVTNFASKHRDPAGIMIAAVGTVSMTGDWTESYSLAPLAEQQVMENPFCFGGSPTAFPFEYQRASSLYYVLGSYPPTPGTLDPITAMGDNLDTTPLWMTWDIADPIAENPPVMSQNLASLVQSVGGTAETHPVSGTANPHSWDVLDETQLCNWFDGKVVNRTPLDLHAQLDQDAAVSFASVVQAAAGSFTFLHPRSIPATKSLQVQGVANAQQITLDAGLGGETGKWPLHVTCRSVDGLGYQAKFTGFDRPPSYLLDFNTGALITGVDSDPTTNSLLADVAGLATLDANVVSQNWTGVVSSSPEPASIGGPVTVSIDMPLGTGTNCLLVVSLTEKLVHVKGQVITANPFSPDVLLDQALILSPHGQLALPGALPGDPALHGLRIVMQAVSFTAGGNIGAITNLWAMHIE